MPVISRIWARSALISAGLQPQQENWNPATGQRNWPTHPAVPPGTDDQNSTPARELEPPQPLLRSLDGGQHPCAKIGVSGEDHVPGRHTGRVPEIFDVAQARALMPAVHRQADEIITVRADLTELRAALSRGQNCALGGIPEAKALEARLHEGLAWFTTQGVVNQARPSC